MDEADFTDLTLERFRAGVLRLYVGIALVVSVPLIAMYYTMGLRKLAAAVAVYLLFNAGMFVLLRHRMAGGNLASRVFVTMTLLLILYGHYLGDEILDNKPWLVLTPILTMSLLGPVEGLVWVIAGLTGVGVVYGMTPQRYEPFAIIIQFACTATTAYVFYRFTLHNERNIDTICQLSHIDPLTGSYNRRCFNDNFHKEFQRNLRSGSGMTVVMIDIDHFKEYNDHYGHQQGDKVLTRVAGALAATVRRGSDLVYRYGGEEFCVLLSDVDRATALRMAEQLRQRIHDQAIPHDGIAAGRLTISVGLCHSDMLAETTAETMLRQADAALYHAKQQGRDRVVGADCRSAAA